MAQTLLHSAPLRRPGFAEARLPDRTRPSAGDAARGILLALGLSSLAWIGLAVLVPRLW